MIGIVINLIPSRKGKINNFINILNRHIYFEVVFVCQFEKSSLNNLIRINKHNKNIFFELAENKSLSSCKNQGINFFKKKKKIKMVWFVDDDCELDFNSMNNLVKETKLNKFDCYIIHIYSKNMDIIGRNLRFVKIYPKFAKYLVGGPSIIVKKDKIKRKYDINFGYGGLTSNAEDTKFMIDNNFKRIKILNKETFVYHPKKNTSLKKIKDYSFGQGFLYGRIPLVDFFLFTILIIYRPILGLVFNFLKFNKAKTKFYFYRILFFFKGIINSIESKNINY